MLSVKSFALLSPLLVLSSASPITKRSEITCKSYSPAEGKSLQYTFNNLAEGDSGNAAFDSETDSQGRPMLVTAESDGKAVDSQGFRFWGCDGANSIGYEKGYTNTGAAYGQLRIADNEDQCVTISELKTKNARFVSAPCLTEDNQDLLSQYFYISQNGLNINFLGNGNSSTFPDVVYRLTLAEGVQKEIRIDYLGENVAAPNGGIHLGFPRP